MNYKIINNDCLIALDELEEASIDSIVTDPPYELNFMGKGWDNSGIAFQKETWQKCLRVLKPGGYLLAFGGSRTFHRIACAIEDAGFEIRDTIMWLYGSGFPKSLNIGLAIDKKNGIESKIIGTGKSGSPETHKNSLNLVKNPFGGEYEIKEAQNEWQGWGTALKPSFEPIIVARKPFKGSLVDNVIKYGVGGINIDECRVSMSQEDYIMNTKKASKEFVGVKPFGNVSGRGSALMPNKNGRFPANTILTYDDTDFDEVCGGFPNTKSQKPRNISSNYTSKIYGKYAERQENCIYEDSGSAARYFYCAKASKKDRDEGLDEFEQQKVNDGRKKDIDNAFQRGTTLRHNIHPTVKPTELMQYLVRLVTPKGGTILDPFMGSGSTGKAVMFENKERNAEYKFIGIEKEKEYSEIAEARIKFASEYKEEKEDVNQISFTDFIKGE